MLCVNLGCRKYQGAPKGSLVGGTLKLQEPGWVSVHELWPNHTAQALLHPRLRVKAHQAPVI